MKNKLNYTLFLTIFFGNLFAISTGRLDSILSGNKDTARVTAVSKTPQSFNANQDWLYIFFKIAVLLIILSFIIYMLVWFLKKLQYRRGFGGTLPPELYKVIGMAPMSYNKQFLLVKFYDKVYLMAMSENSIACLDKIDDPEKIADIEALVPVMANLPDKFAKMLKKKIKQVSKE